jgi:HNH endonuclease
VTISAETRAKLQRAQDLLRPSLSSGDVASILDLALDMLVADLERKKAALVMRPRTAANSSRHARHIPAAVRRAVWKRDGGSCAFAGAGRRCNETAFLEFHHVTPFAAGGEATAENIQLRCRAHNQYEAELFFGEPFIAREREPGYVN